MDRVKGKWHAIYLDDDNIKSIEQTILISVSLTRFISSLTEKFERDLKNNLSSFQNVTDWENLNLKLSTIYKQF